MLFKYIFTWVFKAVSFRWFVEYPLIFYRPKISHLIFVTNVMVDMLSYFQTLKQICC